jgi:hypothetical protein
MGFGKPITQRKSGKASALRCAAQGWRVLPLHGAENGNCACARGEACPHPGKHPRTLHGVKDATTDRKQIRAWWEKWPKANVGIVTGISSGIFALDVDGAAGKARLKELQAEHGRLPKTVTVKTGKGRHLYFRYAGGRVGNSAGRLGEGIDVRGDSGYVVGAGSLHPSGAMYRYVDGRGLGEIEVASAPQWLIDLISAPQSTETVDTEPTAHQIPADKLDRARAYAEAARGRELDRLRKAPKHQRNDTLNKAAFKLGQLLPYGLFDPLAVTNNLARAAAEIGLDAGIRPHRFATTIPSM